MVLLVVDSNYFLVVCVMDCCSSKMLNMKPLLLLEIQETPTSRLGNLHGVKTKFLLVTIACFSNLVKRDL